MHYDEEHSYFWQNFIQYVKIEIVLFLSFFMSGVEQTSYEKIPKVELSQQEELTSWLEWVDVWVNSTGSEEWIYLSEENISKLQDAGIDMEKFEAYLAENPEQTARLNELIASISKVRLKVYNRRNGFIINEDTRLAFEQEFWITEQERGIERSQEVERVDARVAQEQAETAQEQAEAERVDTRVVAEQAETAQERAETAQEQATTEKMLELFSEENAHLLGDGVYEQIKASYDSGEYQEATQQVQRFFQSLESDDASFDKVAQNFWNQWESVYQEYREFALAQNPNLQAQFTRFEPLAEMNSPAPESELHRAQIAAGLNNNPLAAEKYGQFFEVQEGDEITVMNVWVRPPRREVGISGSPMRLERNVPVGDFYEAVSDEGLAYESFSQENWDMIGSLWAIEANTDAILASLDSDTQIQWAEELGFGDISDVETQDIADVKSEIEQSLWLPDGITLDSIAQKLGKTLNSRSDIADFVQSADLSSFLMALKDEKESKRLAYSRALRERTYSVSQSLESWDAIARDVIQSFHSLWIDIAWEELQLLLKDSKVQTFLQQEIWWNFSIQHIDLANGKFWQSWVSEESLSVFRENVAKFANIIYYGEAKPSESIIDIVAFSKYSQSLTPPPNSELISLREDKEIIQSWAINRVAIYDRLTGKGKA